jgi:hypothetical protein
MCLDGPHKQQSLRRVRRARVDSTGGTSMNARIWYHFFRVLLLAAISFAATSANAQLFRSYLSLSGSDSNPCTLPAPCRLLPAALAAVADGGEIWMLNSANYNAAAVGAVTINKGVKILAIPGEMGSVLGANGDALIINAPGKDVTLRNLVVLNFGGGINGINIQNADAVHIEKTTVHDFADPAGSCILMNVSTTVRLFVVDSFLRHCRGGIHAVGTVALANRPSVVLDNLRIERGFSATADSYGIWQQGCMDVSLRNSLISRQDLGIQIDSLVANCAAHLQVVQSELTRVTTGIQVTSATASGAAHLSLTGAQIVNVTDAVAASNSAVAGNVTLNIADSHFASCANKCFTLSNSSADATTRVNMTIVRSQIVQSTNGGMDLQASNGSATRVNARDVTIAFSAGALIKTSGSGAGSTVSVDLARCTLHNGLYAIDHGLGGIRLNDCHMTHFNNTFVNNGSGNITSLGNNWLTNFDNTSGFTYITPTIIPPI